MNRRRVRPPWAPRSAAAAAPESRRPDPAQPRDPGTREKGVALVVVLLILVVLSAIVAALMLSIHIETRISGHDERRSEALSIAEAGISDAVSRIRSGEVPGTP